MSTEATKKAKLEFVQGKEELCHLIEKAIESIQQKVDNNETVSIKGYCVYSRDELELQLFEYKNKLLINSKITKDFFKYKDANVETLQAKEKYCELLQNVINSINEISSKELDEYGVYDKSMMQLYLFELKSRVSGAKEDAENFKNNYDVVFLPEYEKRLEECFKNFDEYHAFIKKNVERLKGNLGLYTAIQSYEQENPNNKEEEKMLMYYETIKPLIGLIKNADKGKNNGKRVKKKKR